jgi:YidC/Oxa1 family membrane protein insertase
MDIFTTLLTQPLANGLILFYRLLGGNMGLAIIGFSIALRFILLPLTKPYMESMKKMRSYKDDIDKLKRRHKGDKAKFAKAQADFYKEKGINPSAGCLPYLLQIVVLIFLFRLFTSVFAGEASVAENFNKFLYEPLKFASEEQVNTSFLYLDVTKPDRLTDLVDIDTNIPLPGIFLILAAALQFVSAKISLPYIEEEKKAAKQTKEMGDDIQVAMQSSMIYTFPLMTIIIGINFASSLALYWLSFSAFQVVQQYRATGWGGMTPWVKKAKKYLNIS